MSKKFYIITRDLHLYIGLFLSPFVLVFAVSVFFLVHSPRSAKAGSESTWMVSDVPVNLDVESLKGLDQVNRLRPALARIGVEGEINFIRRIPSEHRLIVPVVLPGLETTVDIDLAHRTATITRRVSGVSDAIVHLHKMPGPHNIAIRGNATYIQIWRWLADITTYGVLFLTLSGLYLWTVLRAERRVGVVLLGAGGLSFFGLIYAIAR